MRPLRYVFVALPVLAVTFVILLLTNLAKLNKQAWDWTVGTIRDTHQRAIRTHFGLNRPTKRIRHDCDQ